MKDAGLTVALLFKVGRRAKGIGKSLTMTADGGVGCWRCEEGLLSLKVRRYLLTGDGQPRSMLIHLFPRMGPAPLH